MKYSILFTLLFSLFAWLPLAVGSNIDLELQMEQSNNDPNQYSIYSVNITINNQGPNPATGVAVDVPIPDGVVYQGGNEYESSQGTFTTSGIWTVGSIAAGEEATLTINYFLLSPEAPLSYAEVQSANENDIDSTPDNGSPPSINEDDEASTGGGMEVCEIEADLTAIDCDDNGTPDNAADDTFTLDLTAQVVEGIGCSPNFTYDGQSAPYGSVIELGPFSTSGPLDFITVSDAEGNASDNVSLVSNFGNCNALEVVCENNILPNPGFELNFNSWILETSGSAGGTGLAYRGISGISVQGGGGDRCFYQVIDIQGGLNYEFSAYVNEGEGSGAPYFQYLDANGNVLSEPALTTSADGQWTRYESTSIAPDNAVAMEVGGRCTPQAQVLFDSYCLRPVVAEIDAPDLVLDRVGFTNPAVSINESILTFEYDVNNLGANDNLSPVVVRTFFSEDPYRSIDDQVGSSFTLNLSENTAFPLTGLVGQTVIPNDLPLGDNYLIVIVDIQNLIQESNENNNSIVGRFSLQGNDTGDGCGFLKFYDAPPVGTKTAYETNEGYNIEASASGNTTILSTDFGGVQTGVQSVPNSPPINTPSLSVSNFVAGNPGTFVVTRTLTNGVVDFSKEVTIDPGAGEVVGLTNTFNLEQPIGLNGYFIHGTVIINGSPRPIFIKLDQAGNKVNQSIFPAEPNGDLVRFFDPHSDGNGGYYYQKFRTNNLSLVKVDQDGNLEWTKFLASDLPSTDVTAIETAIDGSAIYVAVTDNSIGRLSKFAADGTVVYSDSYNNLSDPGGDFGINHYVTKLIPTPDGGVVFGSRFFNTSLSTTPNDFGFTKLDANGNLVFYNTIGDGLSMQAANITSDGGFLFVGALLGYDDIGQYVAQNLALLKVTADGSITPDCGDNLGDLLINCPVDQTIFATAENGSFWEVEFDEPTVSTTCPGGLVNITQTQGPNNGGFVIVGSTYTVSYEIMDNCGNVETCSFVLDIEQQSIEVDLTCPDAIVVNATPGASNATVSWDENDFSVSPAECDITDLTQTAGPNNGGLFSIGTTTVAYEASGNCAGSLFSADCSFEVTVNEVNNGGDIDLELSLTQANENPGQWSNYSVVATLTNDGPEAATGVVVDFPAPDGVVYVGADPFSIDGGSFDAFATQLWQINSIPAGTSVTLTVNYFLLAPQAPTAYAQVQSANEDDSDSTPGNGTPPTVNEDDEASTDEDTNPVFAVIGCPEDVFLEGLAANDYEASYNWTPPTATTDCAQGGLTITQIEGPAPGSNFTVAAGGTPVVYQITDACGNEQFCAFFVIVIPDASQLICPENITVTATSASGAVVNYDEPTLMSYCDGTPTNNDLSSGLPSGSEFPIGTTTVFREVLLLGPAAFCQVNRSCTFEVTVLPDDTELPEFNIPTNSVIIDQSINVFESLDYSFVLVNEGETSVTGDVVVQAYYSTDSQLSNDDILTNTSIITTPSSIWNMDLPTWFTEPINETSAEAAELSPGDYYLILSVDATDNFTEVNENNNLIIEPFTVQDPSNGLPDLNGFNLDIQNPVVEAGEVMNYEIDLRNLGTGDAIGDFNIKSYISTDIPLSADDIQDGVIPTGNWQAGFFESNVEGALTIPADLPAGNYYLLVKVDADENIDESNELNNIDFQAFTVSGVNPDKPDLIIDNISFLSSFPVVAGEEITLRARVRNTGTQAAPEGSEVALFLESETDGSMILLGTLNTPALEPGELVPLVGTFEVPCNTPTEQYGVTGVADYFDVIDEISEFNNSQILLLLFNIGSCESGDPCDNINVTVNPGSITLTNMNAPIRIQKIFTPQWNTVLNCSGPDCSDVVTVDGLPSGTYYVEIGLFDANWGPICNYEEFVEVVSSPISGAFFQHTTTGLPVKIHSLRPNPTANDRVELMIYAKESKRQELHVYNLLGGLEMTYQLNLEEGWNPIPLDIKKLTGGTYFLQLVGQQTRQMPTKLVVIRP